MADKRLGKGLGALIPDILSSDVGRVEALREIEVSQISPNPFQPREDFDPITMKELKESIAEKGIIQPICVRETESGYQVIAGQRRLMAVKQLGLNTIPAFVLEVASESEMLELALIENIQREDLNPIDLAKAYQRLMEECHLTQEEIAKKVGKERSTVTNFIRLLKLPQQIQQSLKKGELTMGHARALISLEDEKEQLSLWRRIIRDNLTVRKVEELVKKAKKQPAPEYRRKPYYIVRAESKLREIFGTQVRIFPRKEGGRIEIEYYSNEDLERIMEILETKMESF